MVDAAPPAQWDASTAPCVHEAGHAVIADVLHATVVGLWVDPDGSGGVTVFPNGETVPSGPLPSSSMVEAITASQTSACLECREGRACPLFSTPAADYEQDYQISCPETKPAAESSESIEDGVVGFLDPPGVAGDGSPSGGEYPANGVMTYHSGNENGSWLDTCTLPYSQQALCTAVLNNFAIAYGSE